MEDEYEEEVRKSVEADLKAFWESQGWIEDLEEEVTIQFDNQEEEGRPPWVPIRTPQDAKNLAFKEFSPQRWLAEPIIADEGVALLAAESGTHKTWLALDLAICVALGRDWLKFKIKPGKVLYLNCEMPEREIQRRIRRLGVDENFPGERFHFIHAPWYLDDESDFAELVELVAREQYDLIVGDTLSKLHSARSEENSNDAMTEVMLRARRVAYASGGVFLICHHVSKPPGFPVSLVNRIRGASAIRDNTGSAILLQKHGKGKGSRLNLSNPKNWYGSEVEEFQTWLVDDDERSSFQWEERTIAPDDPKREEILDKLSGLFELGQTGFSMSDFRIGLSSSAQQVAVEVLDALEAEGRIRIERSWRTKKIYQDEGWNWD